MERREVLQRCLGGAALGLAPPRLLYGARVLATDGSDFFRTLEDARISFVWMEHRRAFDLFQAALAMLSPECGMTLQAELLESLNSLGSILREAEDSLPAHGAAVKAAADKSECRFWLALTLSRVGMADEALENFRALLNYPDDGYWPKAWNEIGWDRYRRRLWNEAIPWFEQVLKRHKEKEPVQGWFQVHERAEATESIILARAAMGQVAGTQSAIRSYIGDFGRLPWAERRMLRRAGFDADAIYVELRGHTPS